MYGFQLAQGLTTDVRVGSLGPGTFAGGRNTKRRQRVESEWNDKAAGFVGYGGVGGTRAVEHLRLIMGEIKIAAVRAQVVLSLHTDFEQFVTFRPASHQEAAVNAMLDDLIPWGQALRSMRNARGDAP